MAREKLQTYPQINVTQTETKKSELCIDLPGHL